MTNKVYKLQVSIKSNNKVIREIFGSKKEGAEKVGSSSNASDLFSRGARLEFGPGRQKFSLRPLWFSSVLQANIGIVP
jgi:hypothetical protein